MHYQRPADPTAKGRLLLAALLSTLTAAGVAAPLMIGALQDEEPSEPAATGATSTSVVVPMLASRSGVRLGGISRLDPEPDVEVNAVESEPTTNTITVDVTSASSTTTTTPAPTSTSTSTTP